MSSFNSRKGFTIVELIMATAVFSVVLLLGLTGFIQVGRMFYKGVTIAQTREVAKSTLDTVVSDIKLANTLTARTTIGSNQSYFCIGTHRYKIHMYNDVNTLSSDGSYGLLRETMPGASCGDGAGYEPLAASASPELLGNRMRLLKFDINSITADLYSVTIRIAYGADEDLTDSNSSTAECKSSKVGTQFCAVTEMHTKVYKGPGGV